MATHRAGAMVGAAVVALALAAAFLRWPPSLVERVYAAGIYPHLQPALTSISNLVPIAWLDLIAAGAAAGAAWRLATTWRRRIGLVRWLLGTAGEAAMALAAAYLVFLVAWGLNYRRPPVEERLAVDRSRVTPARLRGLAARAIAEVNRLSADPRDEGALTLPAVAADLAPAFDAARASLGTNWRVEPGRPKWSLIARAFPLAAIDGMVNPFGLEVILNPEVLPFERPFVLAHEWGHLAGHADESEASFAGFVTCLAGSRTAQYSGWLSLLIHAWRGLPAADRQVLGRTLAQVPRDDLRAISARVGRAQPLIHALSWRVYDEYLRANGVDDGVASYDAVVRLVLGARATTALAEPAATSR